MKKTARREQILERLSVAGRPVPGDELAAQFGVSRQVIVQDIALLRANGTEIIPTNRGYLLPLRTPLKTARRVFKVIHSERQTKEELELFVDFGGKVQDVFVYHKIYGVVRAELNIKSRADIAQYMEKLKGGKSGLLMNITSGYHYHTVTAEENETLDRIQKALNEKGFLAKLQDYEPVDFSL